MSAKAEKSTILSRKRMKNYRDNKKIARRRCSSDSEANHSSSLFDEDAHVSQYSHNQTFNVEMNTDELDTMYNDYSTFNSSDDSEESDDESEAAIDTVITTTLLIVELRKWALKYKIPDLTLNFLLLILKPYHPELPLCSKTLKKTDSKLCDLIKKFNPEDPMDNAEYVYFGIGRHLLRTVNVALHKVKILKLQFNMDGLPIFKSSSLEFWPILGKIFNIENFNYKPFIVAIHSGVGKPKSVRKYLQDFIAELNHLLENGIEIKGQHFTVEVMCFICDRPARSFIKCIKGHGGYYACERCCVQGENYQNRVIYPTGANKRTNESFRKQSNPEHHVGVSPLLSIHPSIDMIKLFPLDSMHLIFLGVMKKLLIEYWIPTKILRENMLRLSLRLMNLSAQVTSEFQRTTRSLAEVSKWKATELRFFLLYCGPFVLKGLLPELIYKHYLLLHLSCRILSSDQLWKLHPKHAQSYLTKFVLLMEKLYGKESLILNIHSLEHLVEDVENLLCPLSKITAFPFESKLGMIKKYIRNGRKPLTQVCNRMEEEFEVDDDIVEISEVKVLQSRKLKNLLYIQRLQFCDAELTNKNPNNVVILKNGTIVQIEKMISMQMNPTEDKIEIHGKILSIIEPALNYPSSSTITDMYKVKVPIVNEQNNQLNNDSVNQEKIKFLVKDIKSKMILLKIFELEKDLQEWYAVPLLHSS